MAARETGDVRDIPRDIQFAPHPDPDGPRGLNSGPCYQCIRDNKPCDFKEPKCTSCRSSWRECIYTTPSRIIQEPAVESPDSSPLSYRSSSSVVSSLGSSPGSPAAQKSITAQPAVRKPTASKPATSTTMSKPAASKPTTPKSEASREAAPKTTVPKLATARLVSSLFSALISMSA
jgi:hypothetical protein